MGKIFSFFHQRMVGKIVGERKRECVRRGGAEGAWPCGEVGAGVGKKRQHEDRRVSIHRMNG